PEAQGVHLVSDGSGESSLSRQVEEERIEMEILHEEPELQPPQKAVQIIVECENGQKKSSPPPPSDSATIQHLNKMNGTLTQKDATLAIFHNNNQPSPGRIANIGSLLCIHLLGFRANPNLRSAIERKRRDYHTDLIISS
ncbi:hypothetical protein BIW11_00906, partial [Tropilaelaps mercedesae]